jgi:beta-lactamase superfamily II metal-dependent hydrolase
MARKQAKRARRKAAAKTTASTGGVVIRHYCQGIGDCHLLRFPTDGDRDFWMLIDCGVHTSVKGGSDLLDEVVRDIAKQTKRLDVVVLTHEHMDHVSGFRSAAEVFAEEGIEVDEVWLAWTEDPKDAQARKLDQYKQQALAALQLSSQRLDGVASPPPHVAVVRDGVQALLGFSFGAKGERVRSCREALEGMARKDVKYWEPKDPPITLARLPNLRIYVLGPPRDVNWIDVKERAGEMYGLGAEPSWPMAAALSGALGAKATRGETEYDDAAPFDSSLGKRLDEFTATRARSRSPAIAPQTFEFAQRHYFGRTETPAAQVRSRQPKVVTDPEAFDQSWRRIDHDWLAASADLAMQLDDRTNNTSLVLAFEFVDTQRVMLFTGDAQVGNWLSWQDVRWQVGTATVTGPELLSRVVYYKVGHHGSHNATLKKKGLELMTQHDLSAFIPTNAADAQKVGWGRMPFPEIVEALEDRCDRRVVRADDDWLQVTKGKPGFKVPFGSIRAIRHQPGLWVEVEVA